MKATLNKERFETSRQAMETLAFYFRLKRVFIPSGPKALTVHSSERKRLDILLKNSFGLQEKMRQYEEEKEVNKEVPLIHN